MLCYHTPGDQPLNRAQLANLPKFQPMGNWHKPLPFHEYVDLVADTLEGNGFEILADEYVVNQDRSNFFGVMEVRPAALVGEYIARDYGFVVGLRGSHTQKIKRGLVAGNRVFVCSNLAFSGEVAIETKQTTHIRDRLPRLVMGAVDQLAPLFEKDARRLELYKESEINTEQQDHLIMELVRRKALPATYIPQVLKELEKPTFEEHKEYEGSVYYLFNAITQSLKPTGRMDNGFNAMEAVSDRSQAVNRELVKFITGSELKLAA